MAFGEPVSFRTYHLTLPLIISRVLSPQQTLSSSRAEPLMSVFPEPATPRERTPKRHSEMRSLEAHSAPFAWLILLFVWSVREETGSHPVGLPWVKNRPLRDVLAFNRATSLQAEGDRLQRRRSATPTRSSGSCSGWEGRGALLRPSRDPRAGPVPVFPEGKGGRWCQRRGRPSWNSEVLHGPAATL